MNIQEIKKLFKDGKLKRSEDDYILVDGTEVYLKTEKNYSFHCWANELVFDLLDIINVPVEGA